MCIVWSMQTCRILLCTRGRVRDCNDVLCALLYSQLDLVAVSWTTCSYTVLVSSKMNTSRLPENAHLFELAM